VNRRNMSFRETGEAQRRGGIFLPGSRREEYFLQGSERDLAERRNISPGVVKEPW
jgi:hypothetical protein